MPVGVFVGVPVGVLVLVAVFVGVFVGVAVLVGVLVGVDVWLGLGGGGQAPPIQALLVSIAEPVPIITTGKEPQKLNCHPTSSPGIT